VMFMKYVSHEGRCVTRDMNQKASVPNSG